MALILQNGGSQSPDRWLKEPRNNQEDLEIFSELCDSEELLDEQFTEHTLANEEAAISNMLNDLQEDLSKICISRNRSLMIIFLHSLAYRTKQFRDQMDTINDKTEEVLNSMHNTPLDLRLWEYCMNRIPESGQSIHRYDHDILYTSVFYLVEDGQRIKSNW